MKSEYSAYILAGGKSSRMGSDKGLLLLNCKTFIEHICEALKNITNNITIVSANEDYDFLKLNRIEDIYPDKGPVGGIYTALIHSKNKLNFILSVDVPLVTSEVLEWLAENHKALFLLTQVKAGEKASPLIAIYDKSLVSVFENHIKTNQLKLRKLVDEIAHQTIEVPKEWECLLKNINTGEEYLSLLK